MKCWLNKNEDAVYGQLRVTGFFKISLKLPVQPAHAPENCLEKGKSAAPERVN